MKRHQMTHDEASAAALEAIKGNAKDAKGLARVLGLEPRG